MRTTSPFKFEAKLAESGIFEGYASTFGGKPDMYGDIIAKGAFIRSLNEHDRAGTRPALLWAHEPSEPIGVFNSIKEDSKGLKVVGKLTLGTRRGREAYELLADGAVTGLSIGYFPAKNGVKYHADHRELVDVDLLEISLVAVPANSNARITEVRSFTDPREVESILRANGFSKSQARSFMAQGFKGLSNSDDVEAAADLERIIRAATQQLKEI